MGGWAQQALVGLQLPCGNSMVGHRRSRADEAIRDGPGGR